MGLSKKERLRRTAYHEAGHAVACYELRVKFKYLTIIQDEDRNSLGHILINRFYENFKPDMQEVSNIRQRIEKIVMTDFAGVIAEKIYAGRHNWRGARSDTHEAVDMLDYLVSSSKELTAYADWLMIRTEQMLSFNWYKVEALAEELMKHQKIGYRKAREIIGNVMLRAIEERRVKK